MNNGSLDLTTEEIERLAAEVWDVAAKEALAQGLPVTGYHDGHLFRYQPGKGIEDLTPARFGAEPAGTDIARDSGSDSQAREWVAADASRSDDRGLDATAVPAAETAVGAAANGNGSAVSHGSDARAVSDHAKESPAAADATAREPTAVAANGHAAESESLTDIGIKAIEFARQNAGATLEFTAKLFAAKTFAEVVVLTTAYACKQLAAFSVQGKNLAEVAPEPVTETAEASKPSPLSKRSRKKAPRKARRRAPAAS